MRSLPGILGKASRTAVLGRAIGNAVRAFTRAAEKAHKRGDHLMDATHEQLANTLNIKAQSPHFLHWLPVALAVWGVIIVASQGIP